jgi:hypothetical protein
MPVMGGKYIAPDNRLKGKVSLSVHPQKFDA